MNGDFFPLKQAFSEYMVRWYETLYPDTKAIEEFVGRGLPRSIVWAADRMVDQVEDMLKSYQKNSNTVVPGDVSPGRNALFPVVILGMAKDYMPAGPDQGGRQVGRRLIQIEEGGSIYGYRQAMGEIRVQVVMMAAESASARSMASQFSLFVGEIPNRRFYAKHTFGQYEVVMPCMLETPDIMFSIIPTDNQNMTVLACDLTLKTVTPYFDAPREGQPNDGSANNPPGYPTVAEVSSLDKNVNVESQRTAEALTFIDHNPVEPKTPIILANETVVVLSELLDDQP